MSAVKVAVACGLVALVVSACGITPKPVAGTITNLRKHPGYYGLRDDPRVKHTKCLRQEKVHFHEYYTGKQRLPSIQIGSLPSGPTVIFEPTPGIAQGQQITGQEQGAEVIGSALLYPNGASSKILTIVEECVASGVNG